MSWKRVLCHAWRFWRCSSKPSIGRVRDDCLNRELFQPWQWETFSIPAAKLVH